jgi:hypothetical protein
MASRQGGTLSGFTPLSTPNAPTGLSVSTSIGSADGFVYRAHRHR